MEKTIEPMNKKVDVKVDDTFDIKICQVEEGYAVGKKGGLKVILKENQASDFNWGQKLINLRHKDQKPMKLFFDLGSKFWKSRKISMCMYQPNKA